ncbi:unnamed protein product [Medioppia subpectinata]|uniref:BAH domain-containing protein n=1 Tax=Medioppia subpectinata TaxID=1979941 RepID=A0A7R9KCL9_9ACAR|nr:unnamed protein product [Medioppia subpectinata]CAG2101015.1 unnamed protein product [Medioppia subpectinata]
MVHFIDSFGHMNSSSATPISLTGDDNRCRIATPAPSTPYPYSPLSPYGPIGHINPYSFMSRYSSAAHHMPSPFASPLATSLAAGLAYPHDMYHYNPYSALSPASPLTPSSFWSLTAQQSYHQMNGIAFGPSGPFTYNTNAHLLNMFSPNSLSPMSPSPDLHSPSLYPRVSSLPSPYASSPGLSSAFLSPSSMPLLLSPSLSSSVDRPPTYFSDNTSTPSTTPSMTPSIKCEPTEVNCISHQISQTMNSNSHKISIDMNSDSERVDSHHNRDRSVEKHHKSAKHNDQNHSKHSSRRESNQKTITTTITTSMTTKSKEKYSVRVEPLMRSDDTCSQVVDNNIEVNTNSNTSDKTHAINDTRESLTTTVEAIDENESQDKVDAIEDKTTAKVKRELIVCDMSLPSIAGKLVPNSTDIVDDSNAKDMIEDNTNSNTNTSLKANCNSMDVNVVEKQFNHKNLIIESNCNSNSNSSDGNEVSIINSNKNLSDICNNKRAKDAKRESQLKQLQSYRKESHRLNKCVDNDSQNGCQTAKSTAGLTPNTAISIVLPKPKNQMNGEHTKSLTPIPDDKSSNSDHTLKSSPIVAANKTTAIVNTIETHPKTQTVIPCRTKSMPKMTTNTKQLNANQSQEHKKSNHNIKAVTSSVNENSNQLATNGHKLTQNSTNSATKQLPKKCRISRKPTSATIPIGIAIAQQRTSPKTKSPTDSAANASQPLKPILPTLSLPVMANSPILITDSPPAGTSLWIKPTPNSALNNNNTIQSNSQFSFTGDYQFARDSLTGHLYLIRNSSSLPTTPTTTPKPSSIIQPMNMKSNEHSAKSSPSAILTVPMGSTQPQQFFASLGQTQASTLILNTANNAPLVQIAATAPVTTVMANINTNQTTCFANTGIDAKEKTPINGNFSHNNSVNVERGCQASISDDELSCDNMKTTATQASISDDELSCDNMKTTATQLIMQYKVDMDCIHSSEEDDDNDGKRHKLSLFSERKRRTSETNSSVDDNDDESSRDSIQLQIVDELAADEPPQLPVKSAPVMQFIDHHGLDLLVDSIEEFAAREETNTSTISGDLTVNGLQLLSALAEQRAREERLGADGSPLRRHSTESSITMNGLKDIQTNNTNTSKKRQRSESCFTTNPINFDESEETLSDIKKMMRTSGCQTDLFDRRSKSFNDKNAAHLRRSEQGNSVDIKDKESVPSKECKRKDSLDNNLKSINNTKKPIEQKDKKKKKSKLSPISGSISSILKSRSSDGKTDEKRVKKRKKKLVPELEHKKKLKTDHNKQIDDSIESIIKKLEHKKKLKTDHNKQIDDSIESIIKKVTQTHDTNDESMDEIIKTIAENKKLSPELNRREASDEPKDESKKKKPLIKPLLQLYDEKRMKLLDETIDEIIAKELVPSETVEQIDELMDDLDLSSVITEDKPIASESKPLSISLSSDTISPKLTQEPPKPKPLVKQTSSCSTISCASSSASSTSSSCLLSKPAMNLKLTESDLDLKNLNVIMLVDGLLFVGEICPIQAPDIYGITLHGERQHRPIIYSQEEMLKEAIREVKPSLHDLEEGQRVCAYWSTQYRHLYAGYVRSSSPHPNLVFVEFDDGDNGRIAVDDIRLLPQDYPQMKINADPFKNLERKRRMSSSGKESRHSKLSCDNFNGDKKSLNEDMSSSSMLLKTNSNEASVSSKTSKKDSNNRSNSSTNTTPDSLSMKSELKKKKKKHNKEDRHHRHHHNHKHHHCRSLSSPVITIIKRFMPISSASFLTGLIANSDGQRIISYRDDNTVNKNDDNKERTRIRTIVKKTAKQRALDRLRTNLSEKMCTIMSPIRKRITPNTNTSNTTVSPSVPKRRERMPSSEKSKIAPFLPERQLWHWSGKWIKRTGNKGSRTRKVYYKEIERGREHIRVDDCAVFLSTGRPHLPYIGRIDSMWQTGSGTMIVKVRWFYHPEETKGQPQPLLDKRGALFESSHFDVNDVQTISHKCQVISWTEYEERRSQNASLPTSDDPPNVYYMAGVYDALGGRVDMDPSVSVKPQVKDD